MSSKRSAGHKNGFEGLVISRYHCAIEEEEEVTVTGGSRSKRDVTRYRINGESEVLPKLLTDRYTHACGHITDTNGNTVSCKHVKCKNINFLSCRFTSLRVVGMEVQWHPLKHF